jgi:hypothetical protein
MSLFIDAVSTFFSSLAPKPYIGHGLLQSSPVKEGKAIPITGREGPQGCERSRPPHLLDSRLTDGGEVSLTRRPPFSPQEYSWYSIHLGGECGWKY